MNLYQQRILETRKKFLKLNKKQEKELLKIYQELAKQLSSEIASCRTSSGDKYLRELNEIVQANINKLNIKLSSTIKSNIETSSQIASSVDLAYYEAITDDVNLRTMFNNLVVSTSSNTVKKLIQGKYYVDGKTLDQRIWNISKDNTKDIDTLIKTNVARGANARKLAQQLDRYINPAKRIDAKTLEIGMNKSISYQAQRLARTSITHSFSETTIENAKVNPFNKGIKWNLSASHYERQVKRHGQDICDEYANRVFKPNEVPLQHPNCLCYFTEENEDIDRVIKELKAWTKGGNNPKLDKWFEDYGKEFIIDKSKTQFFKTSKELVVSKEVNSGIIKTGAFSGALNPESKQAEKHAKQYYESVRHMKTDTIHISKNIGWKREVIDKIKEHIFIKEHDLGNDKEERFFPSYDMAQSWQRLIEGKDIQEQDIVLLKHEYLELTLMKNGLSQNEAHIEATKHHNFAKYCD